MCDTDSDTESDTEYFSCSSGSDSDLDIDSKNEHKIHKNVKIVSISTGILMIDKQLYDNINNLPNNLRNRIYIKASRNFWRKFVPVTAKIPVWYPRAVEQRKLLYEATTKNIHFLHLPCNTLELNKKYIIGCQCDHCLNEYDHIKFTETIKHNLSPTYFKKTLPHTGSKWNDKYELIYNPETDDIRWGMPVFNPDYDITNEKMIIDGPPIEFSSQLTG